MMERMKRRELDFMDVSNDDNDNDEQERQSVVPFLSDDIIFVILSWAPAKFLYESGKLVRKSWNRIITSTLFEEKHFSQLNPIDIFFKIPAVQFYEDQRFRRVDITEMEILWHSSSGLMLYDDVKNKTLLVKNPITKQISTLPYPPFPITDSKCKLNVVYLPRTREVKVIQNYRIPSLQNLQCFRNLLTVGTVSNKSWRILDSKITDQTIVPSDLFYSSSIGSVVIYWTTSNLFQSITFLAVDLHEESCHVVHVPSIREGKTLWKLIPMETELYGISITTYIGSLGGEEDVLRLWKMRDFRRSKWVGVFEVKLNEHRAWRLKEQLEDIFAWYENGKDLVFLRTVKDEMIAHNLKSKRSYLIQHGPYSYHGEDFHAHIDSLVRW